MSEFQGAGRSPGLEVWRIEKMVPTPWADHGKFCEGDSYIVLKTTLKPGHSSLSWDIHFWLGSETSQDEAGVAAYKTVELDDSLGGAPVQHRETQNNETDKFLSYFKGGVQYISGGVESGFTKVERDVYEPRLLHLKGARHVRVNETAVSHSSLNSGDVFILDLGLTIHQWNGSEANRKEKAKALDVTKNIRNNERGGRAQVIVHDEGSESAEFWAAIGGKGPVKTAAEGGADAKFEEASAPKLFRVSDASGSMEVTEVPGTLKKSSLDTNDVFIVDCGSEAYVWVGKGANQDERKNGMVTGDKFLQQAGRAHAKLSKVIEGGETPLFKEKFSDWSDMRPPTDFSKPYSSSTAKRAQQKEIDVASLLAGQANPADNPVDDGSGKLQIWRIENFEKAPVPEAIYGNFYAGDSYIVLYTYFQGTKECYIIYFWQGRDSSQDEKGASAILATKMDDDLHGAATQVRVVQGKEPSHFLTLFKGSLIIHSGGTASGFKNKNDMDSYDTDGVSLFHVKGTNANNTRAVQVEEKARCLNSGDAFLLKTPETVYLWYGKGCNDDERTTAMNLGNQLKGGTVFKTVTEVEEGSEDTKFWGFVGGKDDYAGEKDMVEAPADPRLFAVSNASGVVVAEEVFDFSQDDLDTNDVFLLDVGTEVYVWIGQGANSTEKQAAVTIGEQYLQKAGRGDSGVINLPQGSEPPMFKSAFLGWDDTAAEVYEDPYERKLREIAAAKAKEAGEEYVAPPKAAPVAAAASIAVGTQSFSLAELQNKSAPGVDSSQREMYLSDADFQKVFKMSKADFTKLKGWKKQDLKKANKLF